MNELEWTLRYGNPSKQDLLLAASVIESYRQMVIDPESKRRYVIRCIRKAMKMAPHVFAPQSSGGAERE